MTVCVYVVCATSSLCTLVCLFDCVLTHANKVVFDDLQAINCLHCRLSSLKQFDPTQSYF